MLVSIVIPTYNRAELLEQALQSVLAQTYKNLQIIVVDDGSSDHTSKILTEFNNQIQTIRLGRSGISIARNSGIDAAKGDYIAFLDSDDLWMPTKIEKHLKLATAHPEMALTYTDAVQFTQNGPEKKSFVENFPALNHPDSLFTPMITQFSIPLTSTVMIKASFLKATGLRFPAQIGIGEDLGFFLQILIEDGKFGYLPEKLTMRRMHESNISSNHCRRFEQRRRLYNNMLRDFSSRCTAEQKASLKFGLRDAHYRIGECRWEELNLAQARSEFLHAIAPNAKGIRALVYGMATLLPTPFIAGVRNLKKHQ